MCSSIGSHSTDAAPCHCVGYSLYVCRPGKRLRKLGKKRNEPNKSLKKLGEIRITLGKKPNKALKKLLVSARYQHICEFLS